MIAITGHSNLGNMKNPARLFAPGRRAEISDREDRTSARTCSDYSAGEKPSFAIASFISSRVMTPASTRAIRRFLRAMAVIGTSLHGGTLITLALIVQNLGRNKANVTEFSESRRRLETDRCRIAANRPIFQAGGLRA